MAGRKSSKISRTGSSKNKTRSGARRNSTRSKLSSGRSGRSKKASARSSAKRKTSSRSRNASTTRGKGRSTSARSQRGRGRDLEGMDRLGPQSRRHNDEGRFTGGRGSRSEWERDQARMGQRGRNGRDDERYMQDDYNQTEDYGARRGSRGGNPGRGGRDFEEEQYKSSYRQDYDDEMNYEEDRYNGGQGRGRRNVRGNYIEGEAPEEFRGPNRGRGGSGRR